MTKAVDTADLPFHEPRTLVLPKSRVTVTYDADPSVAQVLAAQKGAGKESELFVLYLAQQAARFDGQKLTVGEIRQRLRGKDYLALAGALLGESEGDPGK